jgi:hypothetical protein
MTVADAEGASVPEDAVKTGEEITAVSYNIGFGAYSDHNPVYGTFVLE